MAFLESKHRRVSGKFARKLGSSAVSTSAKARQKLKEKRKALLAGNGLAKDEKAAPGKLKLGKRIVTKLEKNSRSRAAKRRKGKRTKK